jgi:hypothetical protein
MQAGRRSICHDDHRRGSLSEARGAGSIPFDDIALLPGRYVHLRSDRIGRRGFRSSTGSVERSIAREIKRDPADAGGRPNIFCVRFDRKPPHAKEHERRDGPGAAHRAAKKDWASKPQTCSPDCDRLSLQRLGSMNMRRREFIAGLGSAAALPLAARAQQRERVRRIGVLWPFEETSLQRRAWAGAFIQGLAELGWTEGRNLRIDIRWNPRTPEEVGMFARELTDAQPDVLVTGTIRLTRALQQQTQTVPIVIVGAGDPLSSGLVKSLSHPEGNTTGVTDIFPSIASKWVELLKESKPDLARGRAHLQPRCFQYGFHRHDRGGCGASRGPIWRKDDQGTGSKRRGDRAHDRGVCSRSGQRPDRSAAAAA